MGIGVPQRTAEEREATVLEAYEKRCNGLSYRKIAAEMAGPPHFCGGHSTARDWVELGRAVAAEKGDPNRKRRARREMAADALDTIRVNMGQDAHDGKLDRAAMYRLQIEAIRLQVQLLGLRAAPEPAKLPKGVDPAGVDPGVLAALSALSREEVYPDERTEQ